MDQSAVASPREPLRRRFDAALMRDRAPAIVAVILLAGASLMIRSFEKLTNQDPGFRADHVLTVQTELPWPKYEDAARRRTFYRAVLDRIEHLPGVAAAGYTTYLPLADSGGGADVTIENRTVDPDRVPDANVRVVSVGYFRVRRGADRSAVVRDRDGRGADGHAARLLRARATAIDPLRALRWE